MVSRRMALKADPLTENIQKLGMEGADKIYRDAKPRGFKMKRARILVGRGGIVQDERKHRERQGLN